MVGRSELCRSATAGSARLGSLDDVTLGRQRGHQLVDVRAPLGLDLERHLNLFEVDSEALAVMLYADHVGARFGDQAHQTMKRSGPVGDASGEGEVAPLRAHSEADYA